MTENQKGQALLEVTMTWNSRYFDLFGLSGKEMIGDEDDGLVRDGTIFLSAIIELHDVNPCLIESFRKDFTYWAADWDDVTEQIEVDIDPSRVGRFNAFRALVTKVQKLFADTLAD